jgi:hypothetical protein
VKAEKWNDELMVAKSALFPFSFHPPLTSLQVNTHSASVGSVALSEVTSPAEAAFITMGSAAHSEAPLQSAFQSAPLQMAPQWALL